MSHDCDDNGVGAVSELKKNRRRPLSLYYMGMRDDTRDAFGGSIDFFFDKQGLFCMLLVVVLILNDRTV